MRATQAVAESGLELGSSESRDAGVAPSSTDIVHALTVCMPAFGLGTVNKGRRTRGDLVHKELKQCAVFGVCRGQHRKGGGAWRGL